MKTKLFLASTLLFAASVSSSFAEAGWVGNSAVNVNGEWYYCGNSEMTWCEGGTFNGGDLGEISALYLGGQSQVYENNNQGGGVNWNGGSVTMYYSIDNGASQTISLAWYKFEPNNNFFQSGGGEFEGTSIDISGFEAGSTHTIAVWFNCDKQYDNNTSNGEAHNYVATFTKKAPTAIASSDDITTSETAVDVKISGLTLYKDTYWTSICLPFSLSQVEIETSPLAGAVICTLSSATFEDGTLSLVFANQTAITAGTPYLVKWTESGTNIVDPIFTGVKLSTKTEGEVQCGNATFKGTFDLISFEAENQDVLFLGGENTLYYPESGASIGAFHSYFELNIPEPEANPIKAFVLNFDDETTSIQEISNTSNTSNAIFTLDGRRLNDKPATAGLYIINGKKVVIK